MSCDLSDPAIQPAYDAVRSSVDPTDWLMLGYGGTRDKLSLSSKGEGGWEELASRIIPGEIHFGLLQMEGRLLNWTLLPEAASGVRRARGLVHSRAAAAAFRGQHATFTFSSPHDLNLTVIRHKLKLDGSSSLPSSPLPLSSPQFRGAGAYSVPSSPFPYPSGGPYSVPSSPVPYASPQFQSAGPPVPDKGDLLSSAMAGLAVRTDRDFRRLSPPSTPGSTRSHSPDPRAESPSFRQQRDGSPKGSPRQLPDANNPSSPARQLPLHEQSYDIPIIRAVSPPLVVVADSNDPYTAIEEHDLDHTEPPPPSPRLEDEWRQERDAMALAHELARSEARAAAEAEALREQNERETLETERRQQEALERKEAARVEREERLREVEEEAKAAAEREARAQGEAEERERERIDAEERARVEGEEVARRDAAERLLQEEDRRVEAAEQEKVRVEEEEKRREEEERTRAAKEEHRLLLVREALERKLREEEEVRQRDEARATEKLELRKRFEALGKAGEVLLTGQVTVQGGDSIVWRRRYFELRAEDLSLFKNAEDTAHPIDVVKLPHLLRAIVESPEELEGISHSFKLAFKDEGTDDIFLYTDEKEDKELLVAGLAMVAKL